MSSAAARVADWLTGRRHRAILIAAALAFLPLTTVFSAAAIALVTLQGGAREGLIAAAGAAAAVGAWILWQGGRVGLALAYLAMLFGPPFALALLLRRTQSLTWCVQVAVLAAVVLVLGMFVFMDDPVAFWAAILEQWARLLREAGAAVDSRQWIGTVAAYMPGTVAVSAMLLVLTSLFLARWLQAANLDGIELGPEFRGLKLGYLIAGATVLVGAGALVTGSPLLGNLAIVLLTACLLQGISVAHAIKAARNLSIGWLVLLYVLLALPTPLLPVVTMALIGLGFVDNWIDVRNRVKPI
ncbi:hypothetical protein BH24PSE2_BH24PSE2_21190 [soil metagenome]